MLTLERLSRRFGETAAVSDISLSVAPGTFVAVIGRSGAGKSTLLRMINRLVEPSDGRIQFDGLDVTKLRGRELRKWRARAAMIFQQYNLSPRLSVLSNALVGMSQDVPQLRRLLHLYWRQERLRAAQHLDDLGLLDKALQRAERLSGGEQQRVAIVRALLQRPELLLADEPIASLDPRNATIVMDTLRKINRELGITVLCNLHSLDVARAYADRVIGLRAGRLIFDGSPGALTPAAITEIYGHAADTDAEESSLAAAA